MRVFIQPSWRDAASDHSEWSGESPDDRKRRSHMIGDNANIGAYSDEAIEARKPKAKQKVGKPTTKQSLVESIIPQEKRYANLEDKLTQLEKNKHLMTFEEYSELRVVLERKITRAWTLLERARGWDKEEEEKPIQNKALSREILNENKCSALKAKQIKVKTENVKHDRKSLSKMADWINRNSFIYFIGCSTIALTAAKIIF